MLHKYIHCAVHARWQSRDHHSLGHRVLSGLGHTGEESSYIVYAVDAKAYPPPVFPTQCLYAAMLKGEHTDEHVCAVCSSLQPFNNGGSGSLGPNNCSGRLQG